LAYATIIKSFLQSYVRQRTEACDFVSKGQQSDGEYGFRPAPYCAPVAKTGC
jgi:hypothetical protein